MIVGTCLHFAHVFMFGFQWWKNQQAEGSDLPSTWFYGLGAITAPLWASFSLTCEMRGLSWWSWTPILFSSFSSSVFFSIFPINPRWFLSWNLLWPWMQRGHKLVAPPRCHWVTCFLCLPGQLTSLRASQKPWWPHRFLGPELITIKKAPTCSQSLSVFDSELLSWAFYQLSSLTYRFIYPFRISTSLWTSSQ